MLGLLLNSLTKAHKNIYEADINYKLPFRRNLFGNGTENKVIDQPTEVGILTGPCPIQYNNLTITESGSLFANSGSYTAHTIDGHIMHVASSIPTVNQYTPLFLCVKDTLELHGNINADGAGGGIPAYLGNNKDNFVNIPQVSPIYINTPTSINTSIDAHTCFTLQNYLHTTKQNLVNYCLFGGSALRPTGEKTETRSRRVWDSASRRYKWETYEVVVGNTYSQAYGCTTGGETTGGGGFVYLVYNTLTQVDENGKHHVYGKDNEFDVTCIHANSILREQISNDSVLIGRGGGTVIIFARNIVMYPNSRISADGISFADGEIIQQTHSYINNLPQLGKDQTGIYWNNEANTYVVGKDTQAKYYYNTGATGCICTKSIDIDRQYSTQLGGAGLVVGEQIYD